MVMFNTVTTKDL